MFSLGKWHLKTGFISIKKRGCIRVKKVLSTKLLSKNEKSNHFVSLKMIFEDIQTSVTFLEKQKKCWPTVKKQCKTSVLFNGNRKQTNFVTFCSLGTTGGVGWKNFFSQVILRTLLRAWEKKSCTKKSLAKFQDFIFPSGQELSLIHISEPTRPY